MTQFNVSQTGQDETVYYMTAWLTADTGLVDSCLLVMKDWSGFCCWTRWRLTRSRRD
ncbi:MAG: hypothetical protein ACLU4N_08340 [Butyricimonas faecihominis]